MLILSRKIEEQIIIDENINVKVVEIGKDYVRLGITAPREIPIYREELLSRKDCQYHGQSKDTQLR